MVIPQTIAEMEPICRDEQRRADILAHPTLNGIDFVEYELRPQPGADQSVLIVHFLKPLPQPPNSDPDGAYGLTNHPEWIRIEGGTRIVGIQVTAVQLVGSQLEITVNQAGDFSIYWLLIGWQRLPDGSWVSQIPDLDRQFSKAPINFKANCPTDFDCRNEIICPPDQLPEPRIDYLAKDYASFRQLLLDTIPQLNPDWLERNPADLGIALVELFAYVGDSLSYFQDAVSNEMYLDTVRQRISARRHARLIDYRMHEGRNAWTYVHFAVNSSGTLPRHTQILSQITAPLRNQLTPPGAVILQSDLPDLAFETDPALAQVRVFETTAALPVYRENNLIYVHTWGNGECCLPRGSTQAVVYTTDPGNPQHTIRPRLQAGDYVLFEEVKGVVTGDPADADPSHRQVVQLIGVLPTQDAAYQQQLQTDRLQVWQYGSPPTTLTETAIRLQAGLEDANPAAQSFAQAQVQIVEDRLWIIPGEVGATISVAATSADATSVTELGLDAATVQAITGLASARLDPFPTLTATAPELTVTIAAVGPVLIPLASRPATLSDAATQLQDALNLSDSAPEFAAAQVLVVEQQLIIVPGVLNAAITVTPTAADATTAIELGLHPVLAQTVSAGIRSSVLNPFPTLTHSTPELTVTIGFATQIVRLGNRTLPLLQLTWRSDQALTFPLCLSSRPAGGDPILHISVARGNMGLADHGRTVSDLIDLDAPVPPDFPLRLRLRQAPLTMQCQPETLSYDTTTAQLNTDRTDLICTVAAAKPAIALLADFPTGTELWTAVPDLLDSPVFAQQFVAEVENDGRATLRFGDGEYGREAAGAVRFTVTYRVGNGRAGNVGAEALVHLVRDPAIVNFPPVVQVRNPLAARDGVDPETIEEVRQQAPTAFRAEQFRAVTAADYAKAARKLPQVANAVAEFRWTGSWYTVFIAIDPRDPADLITEPGGRTRLALELEQRVRAFLTRYKLAGYDLEIRSAQYVPLEIDLALCVAVDYFRGDVVQAVRQALSNRVNRDGSLGFFHPDRFTFGQSVYLSQLYAAVEAVEGVDSLIVTRFRRFGKLDNGELQSGVLPIGAWEIARLDNDANFQENGVLHISVRGGGK
jgi:hypothetical protein